MYDRYLNKQKHKNNYENIFTKMTFRPLESVLKIFGLCCVSSNGKKLKYSWPICKIALTATALLIANSISVYLCLTTITNKRSKAAFQDYIPVLYLLGYVQYIVDLIFVYKYGRQRCLNYYNVFENIDKVIGMSYYKGIRKSVTKICIFFTLVGFCYVISDYTALFMSYGWYITAIHSIDYIYTAIKMLSALDGIAHFTQVKYRLKRMEDILKEYYSTVASLAGVTRDVICKNDSKKNYQNLSGLDSLNINGHKHPKDIFQLSRCYILLLEQCDYINGMFGFRILLGGLVYLMEMVMLSNLIVRLTIGTIVPFFEAGIFPLLSTAMKIVNYSSVLLLGINCCEQTYKQSEKIVRCIDDLLANKRLIDCKVGNHLLRFRTEMVKWNTFGYDFLCSYVLFVTEIEADEALKELRELITTRPVIFTAMNFYTLDYPAMLSMASAVVTYTIILLQNLQ